ncbi:hypothetical protein BDZ91DRAFT_267147 [Kalaharituber pfeilii]|nr:hypothetical protein BDZ91DRAFT_267147 [Kalaharituber pfeilii]
MPGEPSNPAGSTSTSAKTSEKPRKSLDNVLQNVKRAFSLKKKKPKPSKAVAEAGPATIEETPVPEATPPTTAAPVTPDVPVKPEEPSRKPRKGPPGPPPRVLTPAERAQELFKKHGIEITPGSLPHSDAPRGERVHKEIRMRIHRTCHRCNTSFGVDKTCLKCGHKRCKQCPRFPNKKDKGKEKAGEKREVKPIRRRKGEAGLTLPSRTGGQDLVRKPIRQRVHRSCHRCNTDFGAEKVCSKCKHNKCKKCPRDPHKKNKPPGYYSDRDSSDSDLPVPRRPNRTYKPIRRRIRWTCSKCSATFQGTKICEGCGSQRDDTGIRDPPKKSTNPNTAIPSESYMEHLEERLMATSIA